jgi:hypothetical protein
LAHDIGDHLIVLPQSHDVLAPAQSAVAFNLDQDVGGEVVGAVPKPLAAQAFLGTLLRLGKPALTDEV